VIKEEKTSKGKGRKARIKEKKSRIRTSTEILARNLLHV